MLYWLISPFKRLPYPEQDCSGRTVIVTGANVGLGLEAARHFVRLNATKVIIGCRSAEKGDAAKADIEASTKRSGVVEVWPLDLGSFDSVKDFAKRATKLERLDILINNASVAMAHYEEADGHELQVTVNVISTFLLSMMVLPTLRRTGKLFNVTPHLVVVSSDGSHFAFFKERKQKQIYPALAANKNLSDRYNTTKLMQVIIAKHLAIAADCSGKGHVHIASLNPGLCRTQLFRNVPFPVSLIINTGLLLIGRNAEVGSRCLMSAAFADEEANGKYMSNCVVSGWPSMLGTDEGEEMQSRLWEQTCELLDEIEPGVTRNL